MITIGIDIGGSTTKIIGVSGNTIFSPMIVKSGDPVSSLFGAFGKFISQNDISLSSVEKVMLTGVGASYISKPIYNIPTAKVREFLAIGLGGLYLSGLKRVIVCSLGTGTAIVKANGKDICHLGGTGVGGGTLIGLSKLILNIRDIDALINMALDGDLYNIDLKVGDISKEDLPGLSKETTAANFGKINDLAKPSDIALGIINMVFETIATSSVFAVKTSNIKKVVLVGNLSTIPQCKKIFTKLGQQFNINFIIPENSNFAIGLGAALAYTQEYEYMDI